MATAITAATTAITAATTAAITTTAAATVAAATTAVAATAAAVATATLSTRLSLVDSNRPVADHCSIERLNRSVRLPIIGHFDEPETLALTSGAIHNDRGVQNFSKRAKELRKLLIVRVVGQIAYVNPGGH